MCLSKITQYSPLYGRSTAQTWQQFPLIKTAHCTAPARPWPSMVTIVSLSCRQSLVKSLAPLVLLDLASRDKSICLGLVDTTEKSARLPLVTTQRRIHAGKLLCRVVHRYVCTKRCGQCGIGEIGLEKVTDSIPHEGGFIDIVATGVVCRVDVE